MVLEVALETSKPIKTICNNRQATRKQISGKCVSGSSRLAGQFSFCLWDTKASTKEKHDLEFKTSLAKDQAEFDKSQMTKDLKATQTELDKVQGCRGGGRYAGVLGIPLIGN